MIKSIRYTKEGYNKLLDEEVDLTNKRKAALNEVKRTREMGDLSENAAYRAAKWAMGGIDRRLRQVRSLIFQAVIIQPRKDGVIGVGSKVILKHGSVSVDYEVVGGMESDLSQGKISERSPLGKALLGRRIKEKIDFSTPSGKRELIIEAIS